MKVNNAKVPIKLNIALAEREKCRQYYYIGTAKKLTLNDVDRRIKCYLQQYLLLKVWKPTYYDILFSVIIIKYHFYRV